MDQWPNGVCAKCKMPRTKQGHDPCIAKLPGVAYACCGHGTEESYVCFNNGVVIRGIFDHMVRPNWVEEQVFWRSIHKNGRRIA